MLPIMSIQAYYKQENKRLLLRKEYLWGSDNKSLSATGSKLKVKLEAKTREGNNHLSNSWPTMGLFLLKFELGICEAACSQPAGVVGHGQLWRYWPWEGGLATRVAFVGDWIATLLATSNVRCCLSVGMGYPRYLFYPCCRESTLIKSEHLCWSKYFSLGSITLHFAWYMWEFCSNHRKKSIVVFLIWRSNCSDIVLRVKSIGHFGLCGVCYSYIFAIPWRGVCSILKIWTIMEMFLNI